MAVNFVFKRYEYKYLVRKDQMLKIMPTILEHMCLDQYGLSTLQSLYFDTPDFRLIRRSLEKPIYKEKLRLRSYDLDNGTNVYLEIKKKYNGIVYKRRISVKENDVFDFLAYKEDFNQNQIAKEITYFRNYYKNLAPQVLVIYDREAYYDPKSNLRMTIDYRIRYRFDDLRLDKSLDGKLLMDEDIALFEVKSADSFPLWLVNLFSKNGIKKVSISKYGAIFEKTLKENKEILKLNY